MQFYCRFAATGYSLTVYSLRSLQKSLLQLGLDPLELLADGPLGAAPGPGDPFESLGPAFREPVALKQEFQILGLEAAQGYPEPQEVLGVQAEFPVERPGPFPEVADPHFHALLGVKLEDFAGRGFRDLEALVPVASDFFHLPSFLFWSLALRSYLQSNSLQPAQLFLQFLLYLLDPKPNCLLSDSPCPAQLLQGFGVALDPVALDDEVPVLGVQTIEGFVEPGVFLLPDELLVQGLDHAPLRVVDPGPIPLSFQRALDSVHLLPEVREGDHLDRLVFGFPRLLHHAFPLSVFFDGHTKARHPELDSGSL